jgi:peroxiredoxin
MFWATPSQGVVELGGVPPGWFLDVPSDHWAYDEVLACLAAGIVAGYGDGLYHPEYPVTRDQMGVYISRSIAGGDENVPEFADTPTFPDIGAEHWALDYVEYAVSQNVVAGYGDGSYHPEYQVTRDQMAVYVARALVAPAGEAGLADYVPADPRNFPDAASDFWSCTHIEYCVENGVVSGYGDGLYHPERIVTRDQMAVYVQRAFELPIPDGPPAPDFTLQTLDGSQQYRLSELRGLPVAVFFWTSWCGYCGPQAVDLETLYQRYQDQDFLVLGVGLDDATALEEKAAELGLTFPVGYNPGAGVLYGVEGVPYTFIIDRSGSISSSLLGLYPIDILEAAIQEVL